MNTERMSKVTKYEFSARNNWLTGGHMSSSGQRYELLFINSRTKELFICGIIVVEEMVIDN